MGCVFESSVAGGERAMDGHLRENSGHLHLDVLLTEIFLVENDRSAVMQTIARRALVSTF